MLRKFAAFCLLFFPLTHSVAQNFKTPKYPSLFWEINGNGLKKPSYLFGTMHVSNKMVFHLSDSFYNAIRNTDMVVLELNPEYWQKDMVRMDAAQQPHRSPCNAEAGGDEQEFGERRGLEQRIGEVAQFGAGQGSGHVVVVLEAPGRNLSSPLGVCAAEPHSFDLG